MAYTTAAQDRFMAELLALEPGTQNGGIFANKSGYHNTRDNHLRSRPNDYSIRLSADREGPGDKAAAYDWTFPSAQRGSFDRIAVYAGRLLASGEDPRDTRLNGWREFYGQADADRYVEGWDFQAVVPASSDPSHLWHIHLSELRKYVDSWDNKAALLSVLRGESFDEWLAGGLSVEVDEMGALVGLLPADEGVAEVVAFPEAGDHRWVKLTLAADFGSAKVRVAVHDGTSWTVDEIDVKDTDSRVWSKPGELRAGASKASLIRLEGEAPVSYLIEWDKK